MYQVTDQARHGAHVAAGQLSPVVAYDVFVDVVT
jgi:hypothetical protein